MKLREYAKKNNLTYRSAYNHWKRGLIKGKQLETGTIVVYEEDREDPIVDKIVNSIRQIIVEECNQIKGKIDDNKQSI